MIAALYVATGGAYFNLPDVEPWDIKRDVVRKTMLRVRVYGLPSLDALEGELVERVRAALSNGGGK